MYHLSPVVVIILVVVAGLILLYLVARKFKPFGHSLAFVCAVAGRLLVTLSYHMENAAHYCQRACETALKSINDTGEWTMRDFLGLLILFGIGSLILGGESVQVTEVLPSLFQAATVNLPPIFELSSAALFICCTALFGEIVLECWGKVRGVGLFHNMGRPSRWIVGSLSMLLLIFSDLVNGYFYIFRAEILAHNATSGMTIYILGGLGLEVSAVAPFALLAVKQGSSSVAALLLWCAEKTFQAVHAAATFIPEFLDTLALHLSAGQIGTFGRQLERDPHKYPSLFGSASANLQPGHMRVVELPEHAASIDADTDDDNVQIFPVLTPELMEEKMSKPDNASIVFVGMYGSRLRPFVVRKIDELAAKDSILTSGYLDFSINHISTAISGVVDISLPHPERIASTLHGKNEGEAYQAGFNRLGDRLVETHLSTRSTPSALIFIIDCRLLVYAVDMLESIKRRLLLHSLVVVTSVSDQDAQNITVHTGVVDMQSLWAEDIIETVFVTSPRSGFASIYGEETQLNFTAQALVSLLLGSRHNLSNRSFTNVVKELHTLSPFCSMSFASEAIALGSVRKGLRFIPGVSSQPGSHTGDFSDIILQARTVATRVITDADTRAFDAEVSSETSCILLFNTPIQLNDPRFNEFSRDMALWVGSNFPFASSLTVRGNGCAYPYHLGGRFLVQASCIYPLQPGSYPRLQPAKSVKITPLYPVHPTTAIEPVQGNGRVTSGGSNETDTKKPASSSRKSKTRRVVVRKSNKQAK